jgi:pimeloyl-ACP methyl ester carboxylesterase
MHVEKQEAAPGPAVVLIHGLGAYSFSWRATVEEVSRTHKTYAVDLPGFGRSPAVAGVASTMKAQAVELGKWIEAQGFPAPVIVIGHSMGGGIALYLADEAARVGTSNIDRMVLIAPVAYPPASPPLGGVLAELEAVVKSPLADTAQIGRRLAEQILTWAYADTSPVTPAQIDGYARGLSTRDQLAAFVDHAKNLRDISLSPAQLGAIKTRTLLIWGEEDTFVSPALGTKLAADLGKASLELIPECGHVPQEEKPAETNALIKTFLA